MRGWNLYKNTHVSAYPKLGNEYHIGCMQLQDAARVKVLKAFQSALGYMDEDTLLAKIADHLQLQSSPQQRPPAAEQPASDLQAPHMFSCPRKARSRRCRRPASAAAHDIARQPSQGNTGVPSLSRPVSAPAERSGTCSCCVYACLQWCV